MKKMIKLRGAAWLAIALCLTVLCACFSGCGCQPEPEVSSESEPSAATTTTAEPSADAPTTATTTTTLPTFPSLSLTRDDVRSVGISLAVYYYTAAFAPSDEALHEAVAGALDALYADGTIDEIGDRWFHEVVFPRDDGAIASPTATDGSWDRVKAAGTVVIGADPNAEPLSFLDASGVWHGYEVEVARKVADKLGVALSFEAVDAADAVTALQSGRVDCVWGGLKYDASLRRDLLYAARTEWMLEDSIAYYTLRENTFNGESALWNMDETMVTLEGSFSEEFIRERMRGESVRLTAFSKPTAEACFRSLQTGDAFVAVMDDLTALYTLTH